MRGRVHLLARHLLARTRSHVLVPFSPADAVPLWCVVFCGVPGHTHLTGLCRLVEPLRCMSHGQIVEYPYVHSSSLDEYEQWRQLLGLQLSPGQLGALWLKYSPSTRKQILWRSAAVTFASRQKPPPPPSPLQLSADGQPSPLQPSPPRTQLSLTTAEAAAAAAVEAEARAAELAAEDHHQEQLAAFCDGSSTATCASQQEPPLLQSPPVTQPSPPPRSGDSCDQSLLLQAKIGELLKNLPKDCFSPPVTQPSPPPRSGHSCEQSLLQQAEIDNLLTNLPKDCFSA